MLVFLVVLVLLLTGLSWAVVGLTPLLWALVTGFVVGAIAKFLMPGTDGGGFFVTALLGIGGSLIASMMGRFIGFYQSGQASGFIASIIGAIALLAIYRLFTRSSAYSR